MSKPFWMPTDVRLGWGALEALGEVQARRIVVTDRSMVDLGFAERLAGMSRQGGAEVRVVADVEPDPSHETCERGAALATDFGPDAVVALGGGSVIDAAKAMWTLYETPGVGLADLIALRNIHHSRQSRATFVAIPSTSGTGSEVGSGAIVTDRHADPPVKRALRSGFPHLALVDPELPSTMPAFITAATGYDALVHALESYVSQSATEITQALAVGTIRSVLRWLPVAVEEGKSRPAREKMHAAATMGGICMRGGLGIVHAIAHALGAVFAIPHGVVNALLATYGVAFNARAASPAYAELAEALGLGGATEAESVRGLLRALEDLRARTGLPATLEQAGVKKEALGRVVEPVAANALRDGNMNNNPVRPAMEEMQALLWRAWQGDLGL